MPSLPVPTFRAVRSGLLLAFAAAGPALAQGTPRSMAECERLKNDLAYNQCLAMFGPPARMVTGGGDGSAGPAFASSGATAMAGIPNAEEPQAEEPAKRAGGGTRYGRRGGRQTASFDVGGSAEAAPATRARWRWRRRH